MLRYLFLVLGSATAVVSADVILTYESDVDLDSSNGEIIDLGQPSKTATISITAFPDTTTQLAGVGFNFNGFDNGGVLEFDAYSLSDFAWDPATFGNPNVWFTDNTLPQPRGANFVGAVTIPADGLLLATLQVTVTGLGFAEVSTGPEIFDGALNPVFAIGDSFTLVHPEPSSLILLAIGGLAMVRRRG